MARTSFCPPSVRSTGAPASHRLYGANVRARYARRRPEFQRRREQPVHCDPDNMPHSQAVHPDAPLQPSCRHAPQAQTPPVAGSAQAPPLQTPGPHSVPRAARAFPPGPARPFCAECCGRDGPTPAVAAMRPMKALRPCAQSTLSQAGKASCVGTRCVRHADHAIVASHLPFAGTGAVQSTHSAGFSGNSARQIFCSRLVQSSRRRRCSASCSTICSSSPAVSRAKSQSGIRIRGLEKSNHARPLQTRRGANLHRPMPPCCICVRLQRTAAALQHNRNRCLPYPAQPQRMNSQSNPARNRSRRPQQRDRQAPALIQPQPWARHRRRPGRSRTANRSGR